MNSFNRDGFNLKYHVHSFFAPKARETKHSSERQQQRGFSDEVIRLIQQFGEDDPGDGDTQLRTLPRNFLQMAEKAMRGRLILADGNLVTVEVITKGNSKRKKCENRHMPSKIKTGKEFHL